MSFRSKIKNKIQTNKSLKESFWSFLEKGFAAIFLFGLNVLLARFLGPERYGTWSFYFSIIHIVLLISRFGINASAKKFIAQHNKTKNLTSIFEASLKLRVIISLFFGVLFLLTAKPLANLIGRQDLASLFIASVPLVFFATFVEFFKQAFEGLHRLKFAFYTNFSEHGLKLAATVIFLSSWDNLLGVIYSFNLAYFVTLILCICLFYKNFYQDSKLSDRDYIKEIFLYSLPLFIITIGFTIVVELDLLMIGLLSADIEVGIYATAKNIIVKLPQIALAISLGYMPVFAKLNRDNKEQLTKLFNKLLKTNAIIFGAIGLLLLGTAWFFIPLLFGQAYSASVIPLMILVIYLIPNSFSIFLSSFLDYQGKAKKRAINLTLAMVLNVALNLLLIPRFGAVGAAIGTSLSYFPYVILNWLEVKKVFAET